MLGKKAGGRTVKLGAKGICSKPTGRNHAPGMAQRTSLGLGGLGWGMVHKRPAHLHFKGVRSGRLGEGLSLE